jgi:1,4-dihydroxy-2-naphthoate polyprenyltransferase
VTGLVQTGSPGRQLRLTVTALAQLGKIRLVEIWTGPLLAWSALIGEGYGTGRSAVLCLLFVCIVCLTMWASHALDDVTGLRDGSDQRNYAPERNRSQVKPLVRGTLTQSQALAFAYSSVLMAVVVVLVFFSLAGLHPWWALVGGLAVAVLGAQYSYGINFSYRIPGGGELLTGSCLALSVIVPYGAVVDRLTGKMVVQGLLFGSWLLLVLVCSNTVDAADDRAVNRRTLAALCSARVNLGIVVALFVGSWALVLLASAFGTLSPWAPVGLLPAWIVQGYVLSNGLRGRWRNRRNYGFLAVRFAVAGLAIVNLAAY